MVQSMKNAGEKGELVDVNEKIFELNEDIMYRMVLGCNTDDRFDLKGIIKETFVVLGAFNLADFFPYLCSLDIQVRTSRLLEYEIPITRSTLFIFEEFLFVFVFLFFLCVFN